MFLLYFLNCLFFPNLAYVDGTNGPAVQIRAKTDYLYTSPHCVLDLCGTKSTEPDTTAPNEEFTFQVWLQKA